MPAVKTQSLVPNLFLNSRLYKGLNGFNEAERKSKRTEEKNKRKMCGRRRKKKKKNWGPL